MAEHNDFGKFAEEKAAEYLQKEGYKIIARNWRWQKAEIDIIAHSGKEYVIIEVKARSHDTVLNPEEAVTPKKIKLLIAAADAFLQQQPEECEVRFDIISILEKEKKLTFNHIQNAFENIDGQ